MNAKRFARLAAAYGGRLHRWPETERSPAGAFLVEHPGAQNVLDLETDLDNALGAWAVKTSTGKPGLALAERITAAAATQRRRLRRMSLFFSGFSATTAFVGGTAAGVAVVSLLVGVPTPAPAIYQASQLTVLGIPLHDALGQRDSEVIRQ